MDARVGGKIWRGLTVARDVVTVILVACYSPNSLPHTHTPSVSRFAVGGTLCIAWLSVVLLRLLHHAMNDYHARAQIARFLTALADEDAYTCGLHIPCYFGE